MVGRHEKVETGTLHLPRKLHPLVARRSHHGLQAEAKAIQCPIKSLHPWFEFYGERCASEAEHSGHSAEPSWPRARSASLGPGQRWLARH
jgi:hypothetical protein